MENKKIAVHHIRFKGNYEMSFIGDIVYSFILPPGKYYCFCFLENLKTNSLKDFHHFSEKEKELLSSPISFMKQPICSNFVEFEIPFYQTNQN